MKPFELCERTSDPGQREFKVILHEIYPDSCVVNGTGTIFNRNGITWIREFCERALPTMIDKSITAEFLNPEKTELHGHGDTGIVDGVPVFENAETIGHFTGAYIEDLEKEDGTIGTFAIGVGVIDEFRYMNLCNKLENELLLDFAPHGSVELFRTPENDAIVYQYGYKDEGRIPSEFVYSGYALLGVTPADDTAKLLELNNEELPETSAAELDMPAIESSDSIVTECMEESKTMDAQEIKQLVSDSIKEYVAETNSAADALNACKKECSEREAALQAELDACKERCDALEAALNACKADKEECDALLATAQANEAAAISQVNELKKAQAIAELEEAIKDFAEDEKAYAESEINAYKENPLDGNVETITSKIYAGIGKKAREEMKTHEENSAKDVVDIFGGVDLGSDNEVVNIF